MQILDDERLHWCSLRLPPCFTAKIELFKPKLTSHSACSVKRPVSSVISFCAVSYKWSDVEPPSWRGRGCLLNQRSWVFKNIRILMCGRHQFYAIWLTSWSRRHSWSNYGLCRCAYTSTFNESTPLYIMLLSIDNRYLVVVYQLDGKFFNGWIIAVSCFFLRLSKTAPDWHVLSCLASV